MKTFSEALAEVAVIREATPDLVMDDVCSIALEQASRARGLYQEAAANPHMAKLLDGITEHSRCQRHAAFNAFVLGLRVGIAMERSETGGIQFE